MMHVMVDIETLATSNRAGIMSIGAVKFTKDTIGETFYVVVDPTSLRGNFDIDPATVYWWMGQTEVARSAILKAPKVRLPQALDAFSVWAGNSFSGIWSNGANFDLPILRNAYAVFNISCPWSYRQERCYRTLLNLAPADLVLPANTDLHNALSDAKYQAEVAQKILKGIDG